MGEIKKHVLKQRVTLQYMKQRKKIISHVRNSLPQFLSTLEGREKVVGYALLP